MDNTANPVAPTQYSNVMVALHWLMAVLIAAVFATIEFREFFERGSVERETLKSLHFMLGLSVLTLVVVRLAIRGQQRPPAIEPPPAAWQKGVSALVHVALYAIMVAMPILGWLILSGEGKAVPFFGLTLPPLMAENKDLAKVFEEIHETGGNVLYVLIGLHAAAALVHHYWMRDNTLTRMIPALGNRDN